MKPDVPEVLGFLAQALLLELAPKIPEEYAQRTSGIMAMLLSAAAEEWDRAAARRVQENAALRALLRDAVPVVRDAALGARLEEGSRGADASLRVADLVRENEALRALLTDLHEHVEGLEAPEARQLEERIWDELRISTERRALSIAPF